MHSFIQLGRMHVLALGDCIIPFSHQGANIVPLREHLPCLSWHLPAVQPGAVQYPACPIGKG